jgi:hypothetical protein
MIRALRKGLAKSRGYFRAGQLDAYFARVTDFPLATQRPTFRAAAATFVPELAAADDGAWERLEATVARMLARQPARLTRQLGLFLRLLDGLALATRLGRFASQPPDARNTILKRCERAPALLIRRGVWGLRTLVFAGYYTEPDVMAAIGYRATPAGWSAQR